MKRNRAINRLPSLLQRPLVKGRTRAKQATCMRFMINVRHALSRKNDALRFYIKHPHLHGSMQQRWLTSPVVGWDSPCITHTSYGPIPVRHERVVSSLRELRDILAIYSSDMARKYEAHQGSLQDNRKGMMQRLGICGCGAGNCCRSHSILSCFSIWNRVQEGRMLCRVGRCRQPV